MRIAVIAVALAGLTLTACGTTEDPADRDPAQQKAGASGPVTVTDGRGKQVKLDAPAKKVVSLEWAETEMLVSLGVMPTGAADVKGYGVWDTAADLDSSVKDIGNRQEPSVDSIAALQPDLIVMEEGRDAKLVGQLEEFAPVLVTKGSDTKDNLGRMNDDLDMIAKSVGKEQQAKTLMADLDKSLEDAKKKITDAGAEGQPFAMADGWKDGSKISIRMFGKGAQVSDVAERIGLKNAWTGKGDKVWGLGNTDVEGLTVLKDPDIRFFYNASDGVDVFTDGLDGNAIWKKLPFVKANRVSKLPNGIWTFGGPLSCKQYAAALVDAYTA